jgi:hypothetical protein
LSAHRLHPRFRRIYKFMRRWVIPIAVIINAARWVAKLVF